MAEENKQAVDTVLKAVDKEMDKIADRVFEISQNNLVRDEKIDTSTLLKTANVNRDFLEKEVVYPASYASDVEFGRSAGTMPPIAPLQKWVRRKLGVSDEKQARSLAFAIALSIKRRGIAASPYLRPAIEQTAAEMKL